MEGQVAPLSGPDLPELWAGEWSGLTPAGTPDWANASYVLLEMCLHSHVPGTTQRDGQIVPKEAQSLRWSFPSLKHKTLRGSGGISAGIVGLKKIQFSNCDKEATRFLV